VTFRNSAPTKIEGNGVVSLDNGRGKANNVLFFDELKHNFLDMY